MIGSIIALGDIIKSINNGRSSSQSIFVKDPSTHHHTTHKDSDFIFFPSSPLITKNKDVFDTVVKLRHEQ
jgi:hypothetical protein